MGIETFVNDNIGSITVVLGIATVAGVVAAILFPPAGIFLVLAGAGIGAGVALTATAGVSWISKQNAKEPDDMEDEFQNIRTMANDLQRVAADVENLKTDSQIENRKTELLVQNVANLDDKLDRKSKLTDQSLAALKQADMEHHGKNRSFDARLKDVESKSPSLVNNSYTLFTTPHIPSDSSGQTRVIQNQFY